VSDDPISSYARQFSAGNAAMCELLCSEIRAALPQATFDEPGLEAAGKFKAARARLTAVTQIDVRLLRRWLRKARTDVWDYSGLRYGKSRA